MKRVQFYQIAVLVLLGVFATKLVSAQNAPPVIAYVTIEGTKTGAFKGNAVTEGNEGKIECIGFRYSVAVPHDAASGKASGKRQHSPFVIIKNVDYATPQLLQSAYNNEILKNVVIEFVKKSTDGRLSTFYKITLTNASISLVSQYGGTALPDNGTNPNSTGGQYEEVSFTFQTIQINHLVGNTSVVDGWNKSVNSAE